MLLYYCYYIINIILLILYYCYYIINIILLILYYCYYIINITLLGFSQTFLNLSASVDGAVCPGVDVVYNCTTDASGIRWTAEPYFTLEARLQNGVDIILKTGPVTISPTLSRDPFTSTLTISYSNDFNSTEVICDAGNSLVKSFPYRRILGK